MKIHNLFCKGKNQIEDENTGNSKFPVFCYNHSLSDYNHIAKLVYSPRFPNRDNPRGSMRHEPLGFIVNSYKINIFSSNYDCLSFLSSKRIFNLK